MPYLYATERPDFSDLASGRVFYSSANYPAFPVRLASEIFHRCLSIRKNEGRSERFVLYDPCCGAGYLICVLGYLQRAEIKMVLGSDIDPEAAILAQRNLGLLHVDGIDRRQAEIVEMIRLYGKKSHHEALESCRVLRERIVELEISFPQSAFAFQANAFDADILRKNLNGVEADLVLSDVPYGLRSEWQGQHSGDPIWELLDSLRGILAPGGLVAIGADKQQKIAHDQYQRIERFQIGKRRVVILKLV